MTDKRYTVTADNLAGHDRGDTVTAADLPAGVNIAALVVSGHLKAATTPKPSPKKDK